MSRREDWAAPLDEVTWLADDGIRYMSPEVALQHKALQDRDKDRADLAVALPMLSASQRDWLSDGIRRVYGTEHPWIALVAEDV